MNAEEAKRKAIESSQRDTDLVMKLIDEATMQGNLSLEIGIPLKEATEMYLEERGYKIYYNDLSVPGYKKWIVKISWGK